MGTDRRPGAPGRLARRRVRVVLPEHAQAAQFLRAERLGGARVAPAHVPGVFLEHRPHVLLPDLLGEHRPVEVGERVLDVERHVHAAGQLDRAVVGGFHPAALAQREDEQLLRPVGVDHAQADGQHELRALVGHLDRTQEVEARLGLFLQVHLGDEEVHLLLDVAAQHVRRARGNLVAVLGQPGFQPVALLGGEDHDVVLADGVLRLDLHAKRLLALAARLRVFRRCDIGMADIVMAGIAWHGSGSQYSTSRGAEYASR